MGMGDVEGGPKRMVRRYAAAWRICREIGTQSNGAPDVAGAARGSDFFAAIFGDDDSGMIGMDPAALAAWRKYVARTRRFLIRRPCEYTHDWGFHRAVRPSAEGGR